MYRNWLVLHQYTHFLVIYCTFYDSIFASWPIMEESKKHEFHNLSFWGHSPIYGEFSLFVHVWGGHWHFLQNKLYSIVGQSAIANHAHLQCHRTNFSFSTWHILAWSPCSLEGVKERFLLSNNICLCFFRYDVSF